MRLLYAFTFSIWFAALSLAQTTTQNWYDHAVIYEIYPRSFQDTNGDGVGDLNGITRRLDYVNNLGVDAIWITPFYPSPNADFGYDISDYENVAPEYGTLADWDNLIRRANALGVRVLVDFVINHTSDRHPWFKESRSSRTNPKRDWYIWKDGGGPSQPPTHWTSGFGGITWAWDEPTRQWYYHFFLAQQPDLNWRNSEVRRAMFDVARFWLKRGASGFRLDATPYLFEDANFPEDPNPPKTGRAVFLRPYNAGLPECHDVLRELRSVVDESHSQSVLLGESLTPNLQELAQLYGKNHDELQLPMDFLFADIKALDAQRFKAQIDAAETQLNGGTPVFFLGNHDRPRQWDVFGDGQHNPQIAKLTAALTLMQRGTALMYYGEELGMSTMPAAQLRAFPTSSKRPQPDARDGERTPMQWDKSSNAGFTTGSPWLPVAGNAKQVNVASQTHDPASLYTWYRTLLRLRHNDPALHDGEYVPLQSGKQSVLVFGRKSATGEFALVALNMSNGEQTVAVGGMASAWPRFATVLAASPEAKVTTSSTFSIAPYGVLIESTK